VLGLKTALLEPELGIYDKNNFVVLDSAIGQNLAKVEGKYGFEMKQLLESMLRFNPAERPNYV